MTNEVIELDHELLLYSFFLRGIWRLDRADKTISLSAFYELVRIRGLGNPNCGEELRLGVIWGDERLADVQAALNWSKLRLFRYHP